MFLALKCDRKILNIHVSTLIHSVIILSLELNIRLFCNLKLGSADLLMFKLIDLYQLCNGFRSNYRCEKEATGPFDKKKLNGKFNYPF